MTASTLLQISVETPAKPIAQPVVCFGCWQFISGQQFVVSKKTYCQACRQALVANAKMPPIVHFDSPAFAAWLPSCHVKLCKEPVCFQDDDRRFYCRDHAFEVLGYG